VPRDIRFQVPNSQARIMVGTWKTILAWRRQQWMMRRSILKRDGMGQEQGVVESVDSMWLMPGSLDSQRS
jgi:hypothetical protein